MSEIEELLRSERDAELPPPPDVRFTEAAVRRQVTTQPVKTSRLEDSPPLLAGIGVLILIAGATLLSGRAPFWLLVFPVGTLCLCPLLLKRRESR